MLRRLTAISALAVLLAVAGLGACGGDDDGGGDGLSGSGAEDSSGDDAADDAPEDAVVMEGTEVAVSALDNVFRVADIRIEAGATVTWTNKGRNEHDVLPADGDGWGVEVAEFEPGDVYQHTFAEPGVYRYYCSIHGTTTEGMIGTVVVE